MAAVITTNLPPVHPSRSLWPGKGAFITGNPKHWSNDCLENTSQAYAQNATPTLQEDGPLEEGMPPGPMRVRKFPHDGHGSS